MLDTVEAQGADIEMKHLFKFPHAKCWVNKRIRLEPVVHG